MQPETLALLAEAYGSHVRDGTLPNANQVRLTAELLSLIVREALQAGAATDAEADRRLRDLAALLPPADAPASQQVEWLASVLAAAWANDGEFYLPPDELPTMLLALRAIGHRVRALEQQLGIKAPPPSRQRVARGNVVLLQPPVSSLAGAFMHLAGLGPTDPPPPPTPPPAPKGGGGAGLRGVA